MKHRIRAAAIVVKGDSILLVKHHGHGTEEGYVWWVPPGGGVEGEESLVEVPGARHWRRRGCRLSLVTSRTSASLSSRSIITARYSSWRPPTPAAS